MTQVLLAEDDPAIAEPLARALGREGYDVRVQGTGQGAIDGAAGADLVVLDPAATPAMRHRMKAVDGDLEEELFIQVTLGDDRSVAATYLRGRNSHLRQSGA